MLYIDLYKSITRVQAKAKHPTLPDGGVWRTIKGHHVYIKDGQIVAGAGAGTTGKPIKLTKQQLNAHQAHIDKEAAKKGTKTASKPKTTKKAPTKPTAKATAKKAPTKTATAKTATAKPATAKPTAKPATAKKAPVKPASKPKATAKAPTAKAPAKKPAPKAKDIRTDVQKNRALAYDVGDKVGGARKDDYEKIFKETPTMASLADLEKDSGAVAEKLVTKKHLLPPFSFETEHANGTDLHTALAKKLIFDRIAPKPTENTPEGRKAYMASMQKLHRHLAGIKSWDQMNGAIKELSDIGFKGGVLKNAETRLKPEVMAKYSYTNTEHYQKQVDEGRKAKAMLDFEPLGNKLEDFFTSYKSRNTTLQTINKNARDGWDKYLNPETKAKNGGSPKGTENKKWERKAEAEALRTGGQKIKMEKPEELIKNFGVRGVEFGHWVNDASGKYHLQRSAEAFSDLADVLGIDNKDISLNGRLSIAFGARGKGGALAHYEPDRKVINMTKYGGAGSLAHEWGHALDNILYQYTQGGKESLGLASEHVSTLGEKDPQLANLYKNLLDAIKKPAPGEQGGYREIEMNSDTKTPKSYYPSMRRQIEEGAKPEDVYHKWHTDISKKHDASIARVHENKLGFYRSEEHKQKEAAKYERKKTTELNALAHQVAYEVSRHTKQPFRSTLKIPTGNSRYYEHVQKMDGNRSKAYFANSAEMFARVFESYVQHKLDGQKRYNNYLVHSTRESDVHKHEAPFPEGKERTHMFNALEALLQHATKNKVLKKALAMDKVLYHVQDLHIVNENVLVKSSEKLTGGEWRTMRGQHVYIKDGQIQTGSMKGKKIREISNKGGESNGSREGSEQRRPSSVASEAKSDTRGNETGASREDGQNRGRSGSDTSPIRNLSKEHIQARSDAEYHFHRLAGKEGADAFHKAIMDAKAGNDHGAFVHAYDAKEYEGMHMFLSEGGEAGFALKKNGDICSLFHNPKIGTKKGVLGHSIELGLRHGGNKLDCFDGFLPKQYAKWGFEPVAKVPFNREYAPEGWNFDRDKEPDVLFFAHNGDSLDKVLQTNYPMPDLSKTPHIDDYDDGLNYQNAYLEKRRDQVQKSFELYHGTLKSLMKGW